MKLRELNQKQWMKWKKKKLPTIPNIPECAFHSDAYQQTNNEQSKNAWCDSLTGI